MPYTNPEEQKRYQRDRTRLAKLFIMSELFGNKCSRCGFSEDPKTGKIEPELFDFHHRDPSKKEFEIGEKLKCNVDRCIEEAKKCDLLCANCHRVIEDELRAKKLARLYTNQTELDFNKPQPPPSLLELLDE